MGLCSKIRVPSRWAARDNARTSRGGRIEPSPGKRIAARASRLTAGSNSNRSAGSKYSTSRPARIDPR